MAGLQYNFFPTDFYYPRPPPPPNNGDTAIKSVLPTWPSPKTDDKDPLDQQPNDKVPCNTDDKKLCRLVSAPKASVPSPCKIKREARHCPAKIRKP